MEQPSERAFTSEQAISSASPFDLQPIEDRAPDNQEAAFAAFTAGLSRLGLDDSADSLRAKFPALIEASHGPPRALSDLLKEAGIRQLGLRQKIANILQEVQAAETSAQVLLGAPLDARILRAARRG